ncbi:MAG: T9SS type A sorting domain-containing protein, partial [Chitinophagales bacterium]|nr:T9SS type A sorting domain-containing protein [Chitinophagales bacterium]
FGTHTIDILDDDNILLDFVMSSASVSETGGSITAMVSIVNPNMLTTSVDVVLCPGTATSGTDFSYTNTTLTFPGNNSTSQMVTITINDDSDLEANETVILKLDNPTNGALYDGFPGDTFPPVFTGTILDDEVAPFGPCQNLFFSEYIEGSSSNKAVEVYNPTDITIDLSEYKIRRYNNGGTNPSTFGLSGMLAPGDVYVMGNSSADTAILNESDTTGGTVTFFNGNDALELYHFNDVIDLIGVVGQDSFWVVDTGTTGEHTLVRRQEVNSGNLDWTNSAANEWTAYDQNTFSFLGSHTSDGCTPACPTPTGLTAIITGPKKATLEWDDMPGALGYTLRGKRLDAGGTVTITISNPTSQLKATGLTEGKSYWWEVRSICSSDGSVISAYAKKDTFTLCGPPASYSTTNITQTTATLQWSAIANAVKYELLGKEASAPSSQIVTVAVNAPTTQINATGLLAGKTYFWAVRSICNAAGTIISNIGPVQTFSTLPSAASKTEISTDGAFVYPNPASEILTVAVGPEFGNYELVMRDITGKEVARYSDVSSSSVNINVVDLSAGTYFIEVKGNSTFQTKVMVR